MKGCAPDSLQPASITDESPNSLQHPSPRFPHQCRCLSDSLQPSSPGCIHHRCLPRFTATLAKMPPSVQMPPRFTATLIARMPMPPQIQIHCNPRPPSPMPPQIHCHPHCQASPNSLQTSSTLVARMPPSPMPAQIHCNPHRQIHCKPHQPSWRRCLHHLCLPRFTATLIADARFNAADASITSPPKTKTHPHPKLMPQYRSHQQQQANC